MTRKAFLPLGLLAPGILAAACVASMGKQIYAQGIYSAGTTYFGAGTTTLPFPPYHYDLTEISWREDNEGFTIMYIRRKPEPGDVSRRCLEVKSGHDDYCLPMDSYPMRYFKSKGDPRVVK